MAILLLASLYLVIAPQSTMREEPTENSKCCSELYFSEEVSVLEEKGEWVYIENRVDQCRGWVKKTTLCSRENSYDTIAKVHKQRVHIYSVQDTEYGPLMTLPFESKVEVIRECSARWVEIRLPDNRSAFIQKNDLSFRKEPLTKSEICKLSQEFINLPYTWGGRCSYFGFDCSGFVQMLYRQMGIYLPRDSKDQFKWDGLKSCEIAELEPGDLLYWGMSKDDIRHVGLFLGEDKFIHATVRENMPHLRISSLNNPEYNGQGYYPYRTAKKLKEKL